METGWKEQHENLPSTASALCGKLRKLEQEELRRGQRAAENGRNESGKDDEESVSVSEPSAQDKHGQDPPEKLVPRVREMFRLVKSGSEGSWQDRSRLTRKWKGDREVLGHLDAAMLEVWKQEEGHTLWELNCLLYAGAAVAERIAEEIPPEVSPLP